MSIFDQKIPKSLMQTAIMVDHMLNERFHLIPTPEEVNDELLKLCIEWISQNQGEEHRKILSQIFPYITADLEEWLRIQMFNRKQAADIKEEIDNDT